MTEMERVAHKAAQAIQDCLEGKELYRMYRGATPAFVEKILDFCDANFDLIKNEELAKMSQGQRKAYAKDMEKHDKLISYAQAHIPIVQKNTERKAVSFIAAAGGADLVPSGTPAPTTTPAPIIPGGGSPAPVPVLTPGA